jgi:hypothetical protein
MNHLKNIGMGYFMHLFHAWKVAFILIVHGLFPNIELICDHKNNN